MLTHPVLSLQLQTSYHHRASFPLPHFLLAVLIQRLINYLPKIQSFEAAPPLQMRYWLTNTSRISADQADGKACRILAPIYSARFGLLLALRTQHM
jgi:hypothetical protein